MAYHTPELLLVGAAQNLVLGFAKSQLGPSVNYDPGNDGYHTLDFGPRFDSASW